MKVKFKASFVKNLKNENSEILNRVQQVIEPVELIESIDLISNIKKLKNSKNYYRLEPHLLLMGFHGPFQLRYAVIEIPPLPLSPLPTPLSQCKIVWKDAIPSPFNDIEGIAYSPNPKP